MHILKANLCLLITLAMFYSSTLYSSSYDGKITSKNIGLESERPSFGTVLGFGHNSNIHTITTDELDEFADYKSEYISKDAFYYDVNFSAGEVFYLDDLSYSFYINYFDQRMVDHLLSYYDNRLLSGGGELSYLLANSSTAIVDYSLNVEQWKQLNGRYYTYSKYQTVRFKYEHSFSTGYLELQLPFEYYSYKAGTTSLDSSVIIGFTPTVKSKEIAVSSYISLGNVDEVDEMVDDSRDLSLFSYFTFSGSDNISFNTYVKYSSRRNRLAAYSYDYLNLYIDVQHSYSNIPGLSSTFSFSREESWYQNEKKIEESKLNFVISYAI